MTKARAKRKREPSTPAKDDEVVPEEPGTAKFSPQRKLDFSKAFSPGAISFSSKPAVKNLSVRIMCAGQHLLVVIPGYQQTGWIDNLNVGIALCKSCDMRGFKLPDNVSGPNRFAYYNCFENAEKTAGQIFDSNSKEIVPAGIKIGKSDPNADPPKVYRTTCHCHSSLPYMLIIDARVQVPVDYSGLPIANLARQCTIETFNPSDHGTTIVECFGKKGLQLLSGLQSFAIHIGGAKEDMDFDFLQQLQDERHDLVPDHPKDGEDIKKYFQRTSEVMADP